MIAGAPRAAWPTASWPAGSWPEAASRYEVMRLVDGGEDVVVAVVSPGQTEAMLTGLNDSAEQYYVRAINRCSLADIDPIRFDLRRVAFDDQGQLILPVPGAVTALRLRPTVNGGMTAEWSHRSRRNEARAASFNIYVAFGTADFQFSTPNFSVVATGGKSQSAVLAEYDDGFVVRVVVRAVSAEGAEETNLNEAVAIADASAPARVAGLSLEVTPQ